MPMVVPFQLLGNSSPGVVPSSMPDRMIAVNTSDKRLFTSNGTAVFDIIQRVGNNFTVDGTLTVNGVPISTSPKFRSIIINTDNGSNNIPSGNLTISPMIPVSGNLESWAITSDSGVSGNINYRVYKANTSSFPSFTQIANVSMTSNVIASGNSGFTNTVFTNGDILRYEVVSSTITSSTFNIIVRES